MAGEQLQVSIGADVSGLQRGLAKATRQLDSFKLSNKALEAVYKSGKLTSEQYYNAIAKNSIRLQTASNNINKYKRDIAGLGTSAITGGKGIETLNKSTANAVPTLTSFSQVIQDAPYGIRGVANNITQLTSQFGYLQKSTGGTSAALKAMLGTLTGPAGILLAVSAVTSLLVAYGDKLGGAEKEVNKLLEAQKELVGSAKQEIVTYSTLLGIAQDTNNSYVERKRALDKVNSISSQYIGNLDLENINTEKVTKLTDKYTESLIRNAKIKGLQSRISELFSKRYELEQKDLADNVNFLGKTWQYLKNQGDIGNASIGIVTKGLENQKKEVIKTDTEIKNLTKTLQNLISEDVNLGGVFSNSGGSPVKEFVNEQVNVLKSLLKPISVEEQFGSGGVVNLDAIRSSFDSSIALVDEKSQILKASFNDLMSQLRTTAESGLGNAIGSLGESLGTALGSGKKAIDAIGQSVLSSLGALLVQFGKLTIAYGVANLALFKAMTTGPNPISAGAAIAAGAALVAVGSAIKSFTSNAASNLSGGGGGYSGSSGNNQTTSFGSSSVSSGAFEGKVIFEIGGDKLIGVLNNTSLGNLRVGDSDQLITTG